MSFDPSADQETVWYDRSRFEEAETSFQEHLARLRCGNASTDAPKCEKRSACPASASVPIRSSSSLASEIAKAREYIQKSLHDGSSGVASAECFMKRVVSVENENKELRQIAKNLESLVNKLTERVSALEKGAPAKASEETVPAPVSTAAVAEEKEEEEEDFELFGSEDEEEDPEAERVKQERLKAYAEKKSKKPVLIAKSNIILDVKPWDDETDMKKLEECVRSIVMDGLLWGVSKLVPLAYGIRKLQISCVVEDDKVSTDELEERLVAFEDYIQSMDIAAFNKI